jgi:hypothetical protein
MFLARQNITFINIKKERLETGYHGSKIAHISIA